jgi:A/G-specific adenine glycosylase
MAMELPEPLQQNKSKLQRSLLDWYAANRRDFPWRNTNNPFEVLLAEKLLQQTKARDIVVRIYTDLLAEYPTAQVLMNATVEELREVIQPLGLAYRASEIRQMAAEVVELHGGEVPSNLKELLNLTGVGDYCARAVLSFAYNEDVPIVDTNIARLLHRLCGIEQSLPANPARKKYLRSLATQLLPESEVRDFNLAMLDVCAAVCTSQNPKCCSCPLQEFCAYAQEEVSDRVLS